MIASRRLAQNQARDRAAALLAISDARRAAAQAAVLAWMEKGERARDRELFRRVG